MKNALILIYSGGLDSTVLLYHLLQQEEEVLCLSVDYGQRHHTELDHAKELCYGVGVEHEVANLSAIRHLLAGSSQTSDDVPVPEGHYAAESMKATVVPNRNMIMLSMAIGWAISQGAGRVAYAAHAGDHAIYPDCRPEFADAVASTAALCDWQPIQLLRPFIGMTKTQIVELAVQLEVPLELTWSCYKGGQVHCGKCGTCVERREAFHQAGAIDLTHYED